MKHNLQFGETSLPCREVVVDDQTYLVPRGIARNHRNKSWQTKIKRNGELVLSGNYADSLYAGPEGALKAAIDQVVASGDVQPSRTLKVSNRVTLLWAFSGVNVLSMNALVYSPVRKRATTIYLVSHNKLLADKAPDLKKKLIRALQREWLEENGLVTVPAAILIKLDRDVTRIMTSKSWEDFVKMGADIAGTQSDSKIVQ
jgi:hypothetical protein